MISKFTLTCIHCRQYEHKIFHVLSGQLHVICKYTSFPVIQTCNTFQKKLGQEQFRASNEVNWLNNDVIWNSWCQQVIVIMIWYKSSIQERSSPLGAKMGRGSPVCQQIQCPPLILAPLVNMSKGGYENKSALFILFIFHSKNSQNFNLSLK